MSAVYPLFREQLVSWMLNADAPAGIAFYCVGVDSTYTYSAAHSQLVDIGVSPIQIPEQALATVTYAGGVLDAADVELTGLTPGDGLDAVIIYVKWGAGNRLVAYLDESLDASIPTTISNSEGRIRFGTGGICVL